MIAIALFLLSSPRPGSTLIFSTFLPDYLYLFSFIVLAPGRDDS
jgi:hypothetical protein